MIVVKIKDGLGNQMFQYAFAKAFALQTKQKLKLDVSNFEWYTLHRYGLHHFNIQPSFQPALNIWIRRLKRLYKKIVYYQEESFAYNPEVFKIKADELHVVGYFQSQKYFIAYENEIRDAFKIITPLQAKTLETIAYMRTVTAVSIHIRRGDYIGNPKHETDTSLYYQAAMRYIEKRVPHPVYFIFSDDMPWVKENFSTNFETHYVDFNDALHNFEDLHLMSSCNHHIIANSSFSWWGAWLNASSEKIVVAPKIWFTDATIDTRDILPETWITL